jgi:hypothetical protein
VQVAPVGDGADLNAGNELEAGLARDAQGGIAAAGRVVIGDADDGEARGTSPENELRRRERAVGGGRVKVKVYQVLNAERRVARR